MADMFSDLEWFAVVAQLGHHELARAELERQRYRVFLPMCRKVRKHARKEEVVERPLFDRYLFVGMSHDQPFRPICNTRGVAFVVRGMGEIPSRVSPIALRAIKRRLDADGGMVNFLPARLRETYAPDWKPGAPLRIADGPFKDFECLFSSVRGGMAEVLVEIFGRATPVEVRLGHLEEPAQAA